MVRSKVSVFECETAFWNERRAGSENAHDSTKLDGWQADSSIITQEAEEPETWNTILESG